MAAEDYICDQCERYYEEPLHHPWCTDDDGYQIPIWVLECEPAEDGCFRNPSMFKPREETE